MRDKFVIMRHWREQFRDCPIEIQKEIALKILEYGLDEKYEKSDDFTVNAVMKSICPQIDAMQEEYEKQVAKGKTGGRPSTIDNKLIWRMAQEKNGSQISEELGVPKTTIYSSEGWKERKNKDYEQFK